MKTTSIIEQSYFDQKTKLNFMTHTDELKQQLKDIIKLEFELRTKMDDDTLSLYDSINKLKVKYYSDLEQNTYTIGFKSGFNLAIDITKNK